MALTSDQQPAAAASQPTPHSALHPALPHAESAGATTDWAIDLAPSAESVVAPAPWPTLSELDSASTRLLGHNSHVTMTSIPLFATEDPITPIPPSAAPAAATAQAASSPPPPPPPPPAGALALTISPARSIRTIFLTVDQMLELHVGQFGLGQFFVLAVASSAFVPMGLLMLLMIFTSADPVEARKWQCTDAQDLACIQVWQSTPMNHTGFCALTRQQYEWTAPGDSVVSEYNLVCGQAWQSTLVNSIYFLGLAVGGFTFGALCDRFGRRFALYLSMIVGALTTVLSTVGGSFWQYALWRTVNAVAVQGMSTAAIVWATEPVGSLYRGCVGIVAQAVFVLGEMLLALLAYFIPDWKRLSLTCAGITAAYLISFVAAKESPRWLAMRGREERAMAVLQSIAASNKHCIPPGVRLRCDDVLAPHPKATPHHHHHDSRHHHQRPRGAAATLTPIPAPGDKVFAAGLAEAVVASVSDSGATVLAAAAAVREQAGREEQAVRGDQTVQVEEEEEGQYEGRPLLGVSGMGFVHTPSHGAPTPFAKAAVQMARQDGSQLTLSRDGFTAPPPPLSRGSSAALPASLSRGGSAALTPSAAATAAAAAAAKNLTPTSSLATATATAAAGSSAGAAPGDGVRVTGDGVRAPSTERLPLLARVLTSASSLARQLSGASSVEGPKALTPLQALTHRSILMTFLTLSFGLCALVMSYYGSSFGLAGFGGNPYLNFFLLACAELPSNIAAALVIDRYGRVPLMLAGLLLSGVACILCGFSHGWASVVLAMAGKFGSSAAWAALSVYASEVFPTSVRSLLSGSVNIFGRIGGFVTPILFQWSTTAASAGGSSAFIIHAFPYWLMGLCALIASVLILMLPETAQAHQPDSSKEFDQLVSHGNSITHGIKRWRHRREHGENLGPVPAHPAHFDHHTWEHLRTSVRDSFRHFQEHLHLPHPHLPHLPHVSHLPHLPLHPLATFRTWRNSVWHVLWHEEGEGQPEGELHTPAQAIA